MLDNARRKSNAVLYFLLYFSVFINMELIHFIVAVPDAYAQCTHQFLMRMLCERISFLTRMSVHASVPDAYAQCTHQFLTRMSAHASVLDVYAQCTHQFLMRMLSARISS